MAVHDIGSVQVSCGSCGSTTMKYDDENGDESEVCCADCGAFIGTVGGLRSAMVATAKSAVPDIAKAIKKALNL